MMTTLRMIKFLRELKEFFALKNWKTILADLTTLSIRNTLTKRPTRRKPTIGMEDIKSIQWYRKNNHLSSALISPLKKSKRKTAQITKSAQKVNSFMAGE
jgi:hypothetical protein